MIEGKVAREEIIEKLVIDADGNLVGRVEDVVVAKTGRVEMLVKAEVKRGRKAKEIRYTVPYSSISVMGEVILLSARTEILPR